MTSRSEQSNFLNSTLGKVIDNGIDIGLRFLLPDYIENEIIEFKENLINYGLKDGIDKTVESVVNKGKMLIGIVTGDFNNISQIKNAIKAGGIVDSVSELLDDIFDNIRISGKLNNNILDLIENGKDTILNNIQENIEYTINKQLEGIEDLENYISEWKKGYVNKDFNSMERQYKRIENEIKELIPLENTLNDARKIEILHNLVKNNNKNFNLSKEEMELAEKISIYR